MLPKIFRASRSVQLCVIFYLLAVFGVVVLFTMFSTFQKSLSIKTIWKESEQEQVEDRYRKEDASQKDQSEMREINYGNSKLREIETLLQQLNDKINQNTNSDNKATTERTDNEDTSKTNFVLPLDFSKTFPKVAGNLESLLQTPADAPAHHPRGVPMDKMSYMMDPNYKPSVSSYLIDPNYKPSVSSYLMDPNYKPSESSYLIDTNYKPSVSS